MNTQRKIGLAVLVGIVFIVLSLPSAFIFTDSLIKSTKFRATYDNCPGLPTIAGTLIHSSLVVFIVMILLFLKDPDSDDNKTYLNPKDS